MPRLFTLEEARASLQDVRALLEEIQAAKRRLDRLQRQAAVAARRAQGNGHAPDPSADAAHESERLDAEQLVERIDRGLRRITDTGCQVKDIDAGLLDWPSLRDGREVYLCWQMGEADILYWHEIDAGFAGRQLL